MERKRLTREVWKALINNEGFGVSLLQVLGSNALTFDEVRRGLLEIEVATPIQEESVTELIAVGVIALHEGRYQLTPDGLDAYGKISNVMDLLSSGDRDELS